MEVQLYVYDLTHGMARTLSSQLLGIHLDAVYHTSLVFAGIEYFFGAGVQTTYPGTTHHGQPMEKILLGTTHLPLETILEYLDGLREVYTPESYDLFAHNCNNFTNDFAMFLVGRGIPEHITSLPRRVLETPLGSMLKAQIEAGMREVTQAPVVEPRDVGTNGTAGTARPAANGGQAVSGKQAEGRFGSVVNVTGLSVLETHLRNASDAAATIFFTSATCAPCKLAYPMFDRLAEQYPKALFIKVDINGAQEIAARYQIRATPTFITFSKSEQQDQWSGADPNLLKANVDRLILETFPPHPHTLLKVPTLQFGSLKPVTYAKIPPLDKLMAKIGPSPIDAELTALRNFIEQRQKSAKDAALPNMPPIARAFQTQVLALPLEVRFAAIDLLRCAVLDPRVSGFFAEEQGPSTVGSILAHVNALGDTCPHNLRLVTIHLACNVFSSTLYVRELLKRDGALAPAAVVQLVTASLLLEAAHPTTRVAAASLAFNLASANYRVRREEEREALGEGEQVELAAGMVESLAREGGGDAGRALVLALGYLVYCAPVQGEVADLMGAVDAKGAVGGCKGLEALGREVGALL